MRTAAILLLLTLSALPAAAEPVRFAVMGDLPYRGGHMERFDRLIQHINREAPAFSIHVGDIKGGGTPCTDRAFQDVRDRFMSFSGALFYTPGDNEWTDCHRGAAGGFDPLERLKKLRAMFFKEAESLGKRPIAYRRQSDESGHRQMVENAIWSLGNVLFATVHVVGSNNGFERTAASKAEWELRDRANVDWIKDAFASAAEQGAGAAVIVIHANPAFEKTGSWTSPASGFRRTLNTLATESIAFDKPVLIVHGDHHYLITDRPLRNSPAGAAPKVARLQVMGDRDVGAVFVTVHPGSDQPFRFETHIAE